MLGRWKYSGRHSVADFQTIAGESHQNASPTSNQQTFTDTIYKERLPFDKKLLTDISKFIKNPFQYFFDVKYSTFFTLKTFNISLTFEGQGSGLLGTRLDVVRHFEVRNRV